jgi:hypothetical protein
VGTGFALFYIQGRTLTCPFTGYNMYKQTKSKQTSKHAHNPVWQAQEEQCSMVQIKYGLNQQGITEVEIQPRMVEGLKKKNKRPEQKKKNNPKLMKESPRVVLTSSKKVWKPQEEAPKSTITPKKKVWMPKKKETPVPTHPGTENPSSSKQ